MHVLLTILVQVYRNGGDQDLSDLTSGAAMLAG